MVSRRILDLSRSPLGTLLRDSTSSDVDIRLESIAALTRKVMDDPVARGTLEGLSRTGKNSPSRQQLIDGILADTRYLVGTQASTHHRPPSSHSTGRPAAQGRATLVLNGRNFNIKSIEAVILAVLGSDDKNAELRPIDIQRKLTYPDNGVRVSVEAALKNAISNLHNLGYLEKRMENRTRVFYQLTTKGKELLEALHESGALPGLITYQRPKFVRSPNESNWDWMLKADTSTAESAK